MVEKGLVSIIIAAYNSKNYILETLESVFSQTYKNYEIIIVNDGSTDNTEKILEPYFDKIKYLFQSNKGRCAARNLGFANSHGEYIAFLDHDDILLPQKIELQVDVLEKQSALGMVTCGMLYIDKNGVVINRHIPQANRYDKKKLVEELSINNVVGGVSAVLIRYSVLEMVGLFDVGLTMSEDIDMWVRIAQKYDIFCIAEPLFKYRVLENSGSTDAANNLKNQLILIDRWWHQGVIAKRVLMKASSHRYFCAAWAYLEAGSRITALKYICLAFCFDPQYFMSQKGMMGLFVKICVGKKMFQLLHNKSN